MTVSTNSSGIFSSAATSSAAPNPEMLRMVQILFERPKLIEPSLTTLVERGVFHDHNFLQAISSCESEGEQARAQEDETPRRYRQKSIRYEVMIAHRYTCQLVRIYFSRTNSLVPY
jgi:hypothetical protein